MNDVDVIDLQADSSAVNLSGNTVALFSGLNGFSSNI